MIRSGHLAEARLRHVDGLPANAAAPHPRALRGDEGAASRIAVRQLGLVDYQAAWQAMRQFTAERGPDARDEIWLLQHPPVFTYGVAGRAEHLPRVDLGIPVVKSDRGGQVTYHGPGQLVAYAMIDLRRSGLSVRGLVERMESAVLELLAGYGICGERRPGAPGVYVNGAKIAALGLRIRNGCSYHGLSLNVDCDLAPFLAIDPCGYPGLTVTRLADLAVTEATTPIGARLLACLVAQLSPTT
jgi:lipoyl(octanoyl) transferase